MQHGRHRVVLAIFVKIKTALVVIGLDRIVDEHERQHKPLVGHIGHAIEIAQKIPHQTKDTRMIGSASRQGTILELRCLQAWKMLFDQPPCVVVIDGNSARALKPLVGVEQVKSCISAFVDTEASHGHVVHLNQRYYIGANPA